MTKEQLDNIMKEYYYEKNSVDDTYDFLLFMLDQYSKLCKEKYEN